MTQVIPREFVRASRVLYALWQDWKANEGQAWCHTGIFDLLVPDDLTVAGYTQASRQEGVRRRREHVVPRLALCNRAFDMFSENSTIDEVAELLQQFLKIVYVSSEEASKIDHHELGQKAGMPIPSWWLSTDNLFARLEKAEIQFERLP